MIVTPVTTTDC